MKSKQVVAMRNNAGRVCGEESRFNQLRGELMLGEVIWVKTNGSTWWPGQVVDENNVSNGLKPQNRVAGEVLVRLYGSYEYLYVDSVRLRAEFENVLKQNNGSHSEIFGKALEQDISCIKPARKLKKGGSERRGKPRLEASKVEKLKKRGTRRTHETDSPSVTEGTPKKSTNVSAQGKRAVKAVGVAKNSRSATSERASPIRKQDILMSQKRMKSGEQISTKSGDEASEKDTPKQDLVQKKLKAKSPYSARNSPRRQQDNSRTGKGVKSEALISRKAEKEASKNDTPRQRLAQKILKANRPNAARSSPRLQHANRRTLERVKSGELVSRKAGEEASKNDASKKQVQKKARAESARVFPRRQPDNSITGRRVNGEEFASGKAREAASKCDNPKQDIMKKNLKSNSQTSARGSPGRQQDNSKTRKRVRSGELISRKAREEALENDIPQQVVQKKLKSNNPDSARGSPRRQQYISRSQKRVKSGEIIFSKAGEFVSESDTPKQGPVEKKQRPNSPNSVLRASGRSQDLSGRRTRVMQNLGLIAPFGSPFHRNALVLQSDLLATR